MMIYCVDNALNELNYLPWLSVKGFPSKTLFPLLFIFLSSFLVFSGLIVYGWKEQKTRNYIPWFSFPFSLFASISLSLSLPPSTHTNLLAAG
jgi:hypothetical protein